MPLSHSFGLARLRCTLYAGGTIVMIDGVSRPKHIFNALKAHKATGIGMVAPAWNVLKKLSGSKIAEFKDQLRYVEFGSAPMPASEKAYLAELLPTTRICMHYGTTEASRAIFQEFHEDSDHLDSVGICSPLTQVAIIDKNGNHLGPEQEGEICIKGGMVTGGYLNADNTKNFWDGFFRTGDLGIRHPDGHVLVTGRIKEMINVGGRKVNPVEVDTALLALPGIADAAVRGIHDPIAGEAVCAFIVAEKPEKPNLDELREALRTTLAEYQLPTKLFFVDHIPKTNSGKIQRLELKAKA